jgi:hypothetical protein
VISVLIWIGAVVLLLVAGNAILSSPPIALPSTTPSVLTTFFNDSAIKVALAGLAAGFLFFGIAEIIRLLDDIRRGSGLHRP